MSYELFEKAAAVNGEFQIIPTKISILSKGIVIDKNGYFHTGDLAVWTDNKKIKIIGRKKEIIVMANGKNIAPAKIENMLAADEFIDSACVVGDERKYLSALIVPDFDAIKKYAKDITNI